MKIIPIFTMSILLCLLLSVNVFAIDNENQELSQDMIEAIELADSKAVVPDKVLSSTYSSSLYPTRKGVILVTPNNGAGAKELVGHAAIVYSQNTVVEALPGPGVTTGSNNWNRTKAKCYGITVSVLTEAEDAYAADWCYDQIGKAYNGNYLNVNTRAKFYCSHLIWAAFLDSYDIDLDTISWGPMIKPIELVNSSYTIKIYSKT